MKVPFNINLSGKTAIVTGGSGTLCSAMAYGLAVCGAKVAIIERNKEKLASISEKLTKDALDEYNKNVTIKGYSCNVLDKEELVKTYEQIKAELGSCGILINGAGGNPCARFTEDPSVRRGSIKDYPYVVTTYSVVEHWQSGTQTRNIPWLNELIPSNFIELSEELAKEKGIRPGDKVRVWNNRGSVVVDAMITIRMKPMMIDGKLTHVVGMPHHFSWATKLATGDNVNDLTPNVGDPNSYIPEYKAFLVNLEKAA